MPAILGLVAAFEKATGDRMVWGLWRMDLAVGLLWSCVQRPDPPCGVEQAHMPTHALPPSWSWLRAKGEVKFDLGGYRQEISSRFISLDEVTGTVILQGKLLRSPPSPYNCCTRVRWDHNHGTTGLASQPREYQCDKGALVSGERPRVIWVLVMVEPTRDDHGLGLMLVKTGQPRIYQRVGCTMLRTMQECEYKPPIDSMSLQTINLR